MPRLRRSYLHGPGIARRRRGRGFSYTWATGDRVTEPDVLARIAALAIPPAWRDVWICPWPHGHIQAVGTDAAGRRQYRYHNDWRARRDGEKFERALAFGRALPTLRDAVNTDLTTAGLGRRRVLAVGVRLLDIGCFRVGGEEYAEENGTFGVATLEKEHVRVHGDRIEFQYPAKGSILRTLVVEDPSICEVIRALRRRRSGGNDLLAWQDKGRWTDVRAADINAYIKETAGERFSAKDFRTWAATVLAAIELAHDVPSTTSVTARKRAVTRAIKEVSTRLGNTPAVCRSSYIDPRVIDRFGGGETIGEVLRRVSDTPERPEARARIEAAVIDLLSEVAAVAAA